jgi:hypothetical protein
MNSTTIIWTGAGLVLVALLIVASVPEGMFTIACVFGISITLIGAGLIADGLTCSHFYADISESVETNKPGKGTNHGLQVGRTGQGQVTRTRA